LQGCTMLPRNSAAPRCRTNRETKILTLVVVSAKSGGATPGNCGHSRSTGGCDRESPREALAGFHAARATALAAGRTGADADHRRDGQDAGYRFPLAAFLESGQRDVHARLELRVQLLETIVYPIIVSMRLMYSSRNASCAAPAWYDRCRIQSSAAASSRS